MPKITVHGGSEPPVTDEEKTEQAKESTEPADGALVDAPEPADVKPAVNDPKHAWIDYAVSQGHDRADAEAKTKNELVALFTKE